MKILIIQNNYPNSRAKFTYKQLGKIKKINNNIEINIVEPKKEKINKYLPETDILICTRYTSNLLDLISAKKLKWIHITSAGSNDTVTLLKKTRILLTNSSGVHPIPIAEHVFTYLLMFARQVYKSYQVQIEKKTWLQDPNFLEPTELHQKTIGIVGFGRVGKRIAKIAKGFDMYVIALSHMKVISDLNVDKSYSQKDLNKLLGLSDFVIDCFPLTSQTIHFFTLERFKDMKKSAYFINVGRGKTVVEKDLIYALREKIIAGAALDVFEQEPLNNNSELWNMKNAILTPHCAGWTPYYLDRVIDIFCINLQAYLHDNKMPNLVDKDKGY